MLFYSCRIYNFSIMRNISIEKIVVILLAVLVLNSVIGWFIPQGMTNEEHELKLKLHDLEIEKAVLEDHNDRLEFKIKGFKDEIIKNDSVVDNATNEQLDSLFSDYFNR
jgi:uncharacterized ion transporter superfamily protein YfcC